MNSWMQNQTPTQAQMPYNPYAMGTGMNFNSRGPVYRADPIHGENAAWQFPMGANSEIYLPDADRDIIWWIRTDAQGNKNVMPFDVMPHKEPEPIDMNSILERLNMLEEKVNAKQNKSNAKRSAAPAAADDGTAVISQ